MEIAVENNNESYEKSKNFFSSSVLKTLTKDCSLKCKSFDQRGILSSNANAKKGTSVLCEINLSALDSETCEGLFSSIFSENESRYDKNDCFDIFDLEQMSSEYLDNSSMSSLGANNSILYSFNNLVVKEFDLNKENTMLVSTTNFIYDPLYFLDIACLNSLPNFMQSSSVSSELATSFSSLSNISNCFILFSNASLASADQFNQEKASIFCLSSLGTDNVIDTILSDYIYNMSNHIFKSFGSEKKVNFEKIAKINYVIEL